MTQREQHDLSGEARREQARQFGPLGRLVDVGGQQGVGLDADLLEQRQAPRRGRGEDQARRR